MITQELVKEYLSYDPDTGDFVWINLRECSQSQNSANSHQLQRGVEKHGRKFRARIWVNGSRRELGSFNTMEEAQLAYNAAADRFFGEFARVNRVS